MSSWILGLAGVGAVAAGLFRAAGRRRVSSLAAGGRTVRLAGLASQDKLLEIDLGYGLEVWKIAGGDEPRFRRRPRLIENGLLVLDDLGGPVRARVVRAAGYTTRHVRVKF